MIRVLILTLFMLKLKMEENEVHFRHLIRFYVRGEPKNVVETAQKICAICGDDAIAASIVR